MLIPSENVQVSYIQQQRKNGNLISFFYNSGERKKIIIFYICRFTPYLLSKEEK